MIRIVELITVLLLNNLDHLLFFHNYMIMLRHKYFATIWNFHVLFFNHQQLILSQDM